MPQQAGQCHGACASIHRLCLLHSWALTAHLLRQQAALCQTQLPNMGTAAAAGARRTPFPWVEPPSASRAENSTPFCATPHTCALRPLLADAPLDPLPPLPAPLPSVPVFECTHLGCTSSRTAAAGCGEQLVVALGASASAGRSVSLGTEACHHCTLQAVNSRGRAVKLCAQPQGMRCTHVHWISHACSPPGWHQHPTPTPYPRSQPLCSTGSHRWNHAHAHKVRHTVHDWHTPKGSCCTPKGRHAVRTGTPECLQQPSSGVSPVQTATWLLPRRRLQPTNQQAPPSTRFPPPAFHGCCWDARESGISASAYCVRKRMSLPPLCWGMLGALHRQGRVNTPWPCRRARLLEERSNRGGR
jgi:hypothetical protein